MTNALAAQLSALSLGGRSSAVCCSSQCLPRTRIGGTPAQQSQLVYRSRVPLKVVAARVGGVEIPNNKHVEFSIQYIYGIGATTAKAIVGETGLIGKRLRELSEEELGRLRDEVDKYSIEGELRRFTALNIRRLKEIQCYRGRRHIQNLPVHGQRTKTNSRTRKGRAKTVAGKKKAP